MITAEQIPHDAYLAAHEVMGDEVNGFTLCEAIAAAMNAWPDMVERFFPNDPTRASGIFLPLPQEPRT